MDFAQLLLLAVVQGLTEFLPISSSAHLILAPQLFGFADQGLAFDVAVHLGSLLAVVVYFRRELAAMTTDFFRSLVPGAPLTADARLAWAVVLGTVPVGVAGLLLKGLVETDLRSPLVIAGATIGFALVIWAFDLRGRRARDEHSLSWRDVVVIGVFQAVALVPGVSRSGITIGAGLLLGLTREAASRFSFLLAIPTILLSGTLVTLDLAGSPAAVDWGALGTGIVLSFISALACIHYFLRFVGRLGMAPFMIYRIALGCVILALYLL
ncbi:MAG: undecaprenyl-diphosphate phosphatase [Chromatiales bacterium]